MKNRLTDAPEMSKALTADLAPLGKDHSVAVASLRRAYREKVDYVWCRWLTAKMNGRRMSVCHINDGYKIGDFEITGIQQDEYFNLMRVIFPAKPARPIEKFLGMPYMWAYNVDRFHTDHGYCFRATQGLLIHYWRHFYMQLSATDLLKMLEVALDLPTEGQLGHAYYGFYAWLITSKYRGAGRGLLTGASDEYRNWEHIEEFRELWDAHGDLLANCNNTKDLRDEPLIFCKPKQSAIQSGVEIRDGTDTRYGREMI